MDKTLEQALHKRKYPTGQYVCEAVLAFINH